MLTTTSHLFPRRVALSVAVFVVSLAAAGALSVSPALAAGDANQASCANEALAGFQPYLADCRAYEQVTPPFKDGFRFQPSGLSSDGSRMIGTSVGTFGGVASNVLYATYELSRSASGWVASALAPPAATYPANGFIAASADLEGTLWAMRRPSQSIYVKDLYLRRADGTFVRIGPMAPPAASGGPPAGGFTYLSVRYAFKGASDDLSHVVFSIFNVNGYEDPGLLWPGDSTGEPGVGRPGGNSLYEYVGTGNSRPALVGVSDGRTIVNGEALATGRLISDCSTILGSDRRSDAYNAVSGDGETVFFTARGHDNSECENPNAPAVSELYARVGGIETVAISEPTFSQCNACNTEPAARRQGEFRGASRDGSKVFFQTEQELFPGDSGMNLYEYDFDNAAGGKVVRVSVGSPTPEVQGVARVSEDGSHVYFVAKAVLTQGANAEGHAPVAGADNLYVFERDATYPGGRTAFVATLSEGDKESDWDSSDGDARPVQATPDGRFLVFESVADLTPGDTSSERQVFEYDAQSEALVRVSVGQAGYPDGVVSADAHASGIATQDYRTVGGVRPTAPQTHLAVSSDGETVVFSSAAALTPEAKIAAAAGAESVYEYHSTGSISNGSLFLVSEGTNKKSPEEQAYLDASGADVFFESIDPLLSPDVDTQFDLYDARVGGGFPAAVAPEVCVGEACQGAPLVPSSAGLPGSMSVPGTANVLKPPGTPAPKAKQKQLSRAQKLARALRSCRRRHGRSRTVCEAQARSKYRGRSAVNVKGKG